MFERFSTLTASEPDAPALIDSVSGGENGNVTTRGGLLARAEELASQFEEMHEGEVLAVQLPNSVDFVAAFLAALKLRLVFAPIDRDARESEVRRILEHFSIKGLLDVRGPRIRHGAAVQYKGNARLLKFTSGTAGIPKAIVWTESNILADCDSICRTMNIAPHDINLGAIPFSHSYGFSNLVTPLITQGTTIVISNDYLPLSLIALANRHRCTVAPLIPMVFEHLASTLESDGRFETVKTLISAAAPLSAATSRKFRERFGVDIHSFYGCSEVGGITYDRRGAAAERGTVGTPLEGVSIEIDPATHRLGVRGPTADGVFVTDDLAEIDANGEIVLTGRIGDLINTAGKKVNPREVEQIILEIEGVHEAKVYGEPAGARGEVVAAAVVAEPGVTRELVREHCRARLSAHKVPRIVKLIERIPIDERGKVKRAALISAQ
jgi:acyl-CoA synthetase (AMP-forming)/AMP-acid ligase II